MIPDTEVILLGSIVAFAASAAIGFFYLGSTSKKILILASIGLVLIAGYLAMFTTFSGPIEIQKLVAFFILSFPGFFVFFFLPIFPGYFLGTYLKKHLKRNA